MAEFIVFQHHHYGWSKFTHHASDAERAMTADILRTHPWLSEYQYALEFEDGAYSVTYTGPTRAIAGGYQYPGDHWFADQIRIGQPDDCSSCGGTGENHYYSWKQCYACGDESRDGVGTGKEAAE